MKREEFPIHIQNLFDNLDEVEELVNIHKEIAGSSKGRKSGVQVLNKSAIILLTACWETFVEELLSASFDFLISNANTHNVIPYSVLTKASEDLKNNKDGRKVWELAGNGWVEILKTYKNQIITKEIDYFHVPRPENIDAIFEKLLGTSNITSCWKWKKMSNANAKKTWNNYINLRGEIAHKVKSSNSVLKKDVLSYKHFINCCGVKLQNAITIHLYNLTGKKAWDKFFYRGFS